MWNQWIWFNLQLLEYSLNEDIDSVDSTESQEKIHKQNIEPSRIWSQDLWLSCNTLHPWASPPFAVSHRDLNDHVFVLYWFFDSEN